MDFLQIMTLAEKYLHLINPTSVEKILRVGEHLQLQRGDRLLDFGCGFAEPLVLWAKEFEFSAVGLEFREETCSRAKERIEGAGLSDRIEVICTNAADYPYEAKAFDVATCLGASFIWGGVEPALKALSNVIHEKGRIAIGEPYWKTDPPLVDLGFSVHSEHELLEIIHERGLVLRYIVRSSEDDWDQYETGNWYALTEWLRENPDHPEREDVRTHLRKAQDEYTQFTRAHLGWAIYLLEHER